jgi:acetaldehyde dehydrogenase (acetylating)
MADAHVPSPRSDRDLASMGEARALARRARAAHLQYAEFSQERIDAVVDAAAGAVAPLAESLATLAVEETGFGVVADKIQKNTFAAVRVHEFVKPLKTVGVIRRDDSRKIVEIAEPFGPVAAIIPSTNPTSTAIYKILIALKARCAIVLSPHPSAVRCITRVAEVMSAAAVAAGAPEGTISWMTTVTLEGTQELMRQREIAVILATGGMGLVRAAYSAGKPAYGVGPGNASTARPTSSRPLQTSSSARASTTACCARRPIPWSPTPPSPRRSRPNSARRGPTSWRRTKTRRWPRSW